MQESFPQAPHWLQYGLGIVAAILSGVGIDKLYNSWLNRHKPSAEIHVTEATAAEIKVRAHSSAGDALSRMMDRLDMAQVTIDGLRERLAKAEGLALRAEADAQAAQMFVEQLNAAAKLAGVRLSDYTPTQLKQAANESCEDA